LRRFIQNYFPPLKVRNPFSQTSIADPGCSPPFSLRVPSRAWSAFLIPWFPRSEDTFSSEASPMAFFFPRLFFYEKRIQSFFPPVPACGSWTHLRRPVPNFLSPAGNGDHSSGLSPFRTFKAAPFPPSTALPFPPLFFRYETTLLLLTPHLSVLVSPQNLFTYHSLSARWRSGSTFAATCFPLEGRPPLLLLISAQEWILVFVVPQLPGQVVAVAPSDFS